MQELADARVVHYDLKADNVLLEPMPAPRGQRPGLGANPDPDPAAGLWALPSESPPFPLMNRLIVDAARPSSLAMR